MKNSINPKKFNNVSESEDSEVGDVPDFTDAKLKVLEYLRKKSNTTIEDFEDDIDTDWGD